MSDKLTLITLPGSDFSGIQDWGEHTVGEMIENVRSYGRYLQSQADAISNASDADFNVTVVRGSLAQHHIKTLQKSVKINDN